MVKNLGNSRPGAADDRADDRLVSADSATGDAATVCCPAGAAVSFRASSMLPPNAVATPLPRGHATHQFDVNL
jgi:hypothetical protein